MGFQHVELRDSPRPTYSPVVLYDPRRPTDSLFIKELVEPADPHARIVELPYAGHAVLIALKENAKLNEFLVQLFEGDTLIELELQGQGSYVWHLNYGDERFRLGDLDEAELQFRRSLEVRFNRIAAKRLARLLNAQGRWKELSALAERGQCELGNLRFMEGIEQETSEAEGDDG